MKKIHLLQIVLLGACVVLVAIPGAANATLTTDLEAYWPFDVDGSDGSGNSKDVTLNGSAAISTGDSGKLGEALSLSNSAGGAGATDFAVRPVVDTEFHFMANDFTVQTWVKLNDTSREQIMMEQWNEMSGPGWTFAARPSGGNDFRFIGIGTPGNVARGDRGDGNVGDPTAWNHLVMRREGPLMDYFLNGTKIASANSSRDEDDVSTNSINVSTAPLLIGKRTNEDGRGFGFNGMLDETAIWSRGISDVEVAMLYNGGAGQALPEPSTIALLCCGSVALLGLAWRRRR